MANAHPVDIGLAEHELYCDDVDSEEEDEVASTSGNSSNKQNGTVSSNLAQTSPVQTDRFGFIGGDQYTDPER